MLVQREQSAVNHLIRKYGLKLYLIIDDKHNLWKNSKKNQNIFLFKIVFFLFLHEICCVKI